MELNENHKHRLLSTFQYIDELLCDIKQILSPAQSHGLFEQYTLDISPMQQELLEPGIAEFRALMHRILERLDIPIPPPRISAQRAVLTSLTFVDIAIDELKAKYMRGYGQLGEKAAEELDGIVSAMKELIEGTINLLPEQPTRRR